PAGSTDSATSLDSTGTQPPCVGEPRSSPGISFRSSYCLQLDFPEERSLQGRMSVGRNPFSVRTLCRSPADGSGRHPAALPPLWRRRNDPTGRATFAGAAALNPTGPPDAGPPCGQLEGNVQNSGVLLSRDQWRKSDEILLCAGSCPVTG